MAHTSLVFQPPFQTNFSFPKKTMAFKTTVRTPVSGRGEIRASLQPYPVWTWEWPVNFLRGSEQNNGSDYQYLASFFMQVGGMFSDFLLEDAYDNAVTNQTFAIADGATTQYQLVRSIGIGTDIVQNLKAAPTIAGSPGTLPTYTVGSTGIISFATAPPANMNLTWSGSYYFRVRFDSDEAEFDQMMDQLWSMPSVKLRSVIL